MKIHLINAETAEGKSIDVTLFNNNKRKDCRHLMVWPGRIGAEAEICATDEWLSEEEIKEMNDIELAGYLLMCRTDYRKELPHISACTVELTKVDRIFD